VLLQAFKNELAALGRFTEILQQEQAALIKADVDQLILISAEKLKQAELLNRLSSERLSALNIQNVPSDRLSMESWLSSQPAQVVAAWNALLEAAKTAQQLNQTNGKLIESQLQSNQQALNVLANAANKSAVYGSDGQPRTVHPTSQRTLGKG
jgi:flagella synthesis protein FlgN